MGFYLDICNNSMKNKYHDSLSEHGYVKCIHIEKKIKNPNYFNIDELFRDFITHYNKKLDLYVVKSEFEVKSNHFSHFTRTEFF